MNTFYNCGIICPFFLQFLRIYDVLALSGNTLMKTRGRVFYNNHFDNVSPFVIFLVTFFSSLTAICTLIDIDGNIHNAFTFSCTVTQTTHLSVLLLPI